MYEDGEEKSILMIGATGTGKSTLIDGIFNHILGVEYEDNFRFTIIDMKEEEKEKTEVCKWITQFGFSLEFIY